MSQPVGRLPPHLLPRPKAAATSSSTSLDALATTTTPQSSRDSSQQRHVQGSVAVTPSTDVSVKATSTLIRRVLCPLAQGGPTEPRPLEEILPPLTSSNEVDVELYALIAIVIKEFVYSWYGKITPDQTFVEETIRIIAHCTRDLEQRIRRVDTESLLLDEIPDLLRRHISGWSRPAAPHLTDD